MSQEVYMEKPATYDAYQPKILKAIAERYCTLPQIKAKAGIDRSVDISGLLTWMIDHNEIVRLENANLTAYFSPEKIPTKFWSNGDGRVAVEFADNKAEANSNGKKPGVAVKPEKKNNPNFTEENFTNWGKKNFGAVDIAEELGITRQSVATFLRWNPNMKEALEAGRKSVEKTVVNTESELPETGWGFKVEELAQAKIPEVEIEPELSEIPNQPDEPEATILEPVQEWIPAFPDDRVEFPKLEALFPVEDKPVQAEDLNLLKYDDLNRIFGNWLNDVWQIVYPGRTDWDYPAQVIRHIQQHVEDLTQKANTPPPQYFRGIKSKQPNSRFRGGTEKLGTFGNYFVRRGRKDRTFRRSELVCSGLRHPTVR
jgi:hypothetical protein